MPENNLSVREIEIPDIELITRYWLNADASFLHNMGVDLSKIPAKEQLQNNLLTQLKTPVGQRNSYCIIWQVDGIPVGHSNTNPTIFGKEAYMHLHLWQNDSRKKGIGLELLKLTLPCFFNTLKLENIYSEPYALNPAPNKTLPKAGFEFVKEYITIPGSLNFEQPVKRWQLSFERFKQLYL